MEVKSSEIKDRNDVNSNKTRPWPLTERNAFSGKWETHRKANTVPAELSV